MPVRRMNASFDDDASSDSNSRGGEFNNLLNRSSFQNSSLQISSASGASTSSRLVENEISMRNTDGNNNDIAVLTRKFIFSLLLSIVAWYGPKQYAAHENHIAKKKIPVQKTQQGEIVLDALLNQPLVNPPTIPCAFLHVMKLCSDRNWSHSHIPAFCVHQLPCSYIRECGFLLSFVSFLPGYLHGSVVEVLGRRYLPGWLCGKFMVVFAHF